MISIYVVVGVSILIAKRWRDCCFFFLRFISFETFVPACEYDYEYMLQKKIPMHNYIHDGLVWLGSTRRVRTERKGKCLLWNKNKLKLILFLFEAYTQFVSFVFYLNDIHVFVNQNGANRSFILLDSFYVFVVFYCIFQKNRVHIVQIIHKISWYRHFTCIKKADTYTLWTQTIM